MPKAQNLSSVEEQHLICRDLLHAWYTVQDFTIRDSETKRRVGIIRRVLECTRCHTQREDLIWLKSFERLSSRYIYPEGYRIEGGHRGLTKKTEIREEVYKRAVAKGKVTKA